MQQRHNHGGLQIPLDQTLATHPTAPLPAGAVHHWLSIVDQQPYLSDRADQHPWPQSTLSGSASQSPCSSQPTSPALSPAPSLEPGQGPSPVDAAGQHNTASQPYHGLQHRLSAIAIAMDNEVQRLLCEDSSLADGSQADRQLLELYIRLWQADAIKQGKMP